MLFHLRENSFSLTRSVSLSPGQPNCEAMWKIVPSNRVVLFCSDKHVSIQVGRSSFLSKGTKMTPTSPSVRCESHSYINFMNHCQCRGMGVLSCGGDVPVANLLGPKNSRLKQCPTLQKYILAWPWRNSFSMESPRFMYLKSVLTMLGQTLDELSLRSSR